MAAAENVPELGGYDYEFISKVPDDFECPVCQLTMKDPIQIGGCGHRLCNVCLEALLRRPSPKCPVDRQPLSRDKIFPDIACHRKILDLTVKCSYVGCPWTGELRAVEKHQSKCLLKVVKCPNAGCTETFTKQDMDNHKAFECSWRKVNCEYCQESFIFNNKQQHFGVCQKFPVHCTNKCGLRDIPREKLLVHIRDECPLTEVHCEYKNLGCEEVFPRRGAKSHSESQVERHLNLALRGLEATQCQFKVQSQQIARLMSRDTAHSQQIVELMSTVQDQSQKIDRLMCKNINQSEEIERLVSKVQNQSQHIKELMVKDQHQEQQMMAMPSKAKSQSQESRRSTVKHEPSATLSFILKKMKKELEQENDNGKTQAVKQNFKPKSIRDITLGMEVLVKMEREKEGRGIVRFKGTSWSQTPLIGVELDPGQEGNSDGTFLGRRYFTCEPNRGIFVEFEDIIKCYI